MKLKKLKLYEIASATKSDQFYLNKSRQCSLIYRNVGKTKSYSLYLNLFKKSEIAIDSDANFNPQKITEILRKL